ncbi:MAG: hypothetical protein A2X13_00795 [Bacteroidetes bacterium GWC2_33_15]|nr:MAG: hypothetical protein A2X10_04610 [Bacteroidetes bacterium GWA2_33_15]OFX51156.1 MAG: hypothetical protein A2X13_00795 [Bacteroidetes bacterium GWC2_33_15]OFX66411.1 MAG: hypothetical protein A2X15_07160 [Bacteroidetes bacterium GWB2_32_14]OFX70364.1 MAG: hypothetical protein A2X14_03685 [Bacteroidetes bacterium GWD2_33_33]HAN17368.1 hypothetical protein [Bacteroidales bacterium]
MSIYSYRKISKLKFTIMKKLTYLLLFAFIASSVFIACDDEEETVSPFHTVKLGAQDNTSIGGFYSINDKKVYTQDVAATKQETIDFLCFYEEGNDISLASPGANITDIFTGTTSPETWTTTDTTWFYQTELTTVQFDALTEDDELIVTSYNADEARRKAKLLTVGNIYAFKTQDAYYGLFKVTEVVPDSIGSVEFTYIIKK